jgi:hypothetical protein
MISVLFGFPFGVTPPNQVIVCATPPICTAFGRYAVPPWFRTIVSPIAVFVGNAVFAKFAVKLLAI